MQADENGESIDFNTFSISAFDKEQYASLSAYYEQYVAPKLGQFDYKEKNLKVVTDTATYWYDANRETIVESANGQEKALGCGKLVVKGAFKKAGKNGKDNIEITVELTPDYQKDYEIIPYAPESTINQQQIDAFMDRYITRPFRHIDNVVGVEINFNKVFYKPEPLREVSIIVDELARLEAELNELENELF